MIVFYSTIVHKCIVARHTWVVAFFVFQNIFTFWSFFLPVKRVRNVRAAKRAIVNSISGLHWKAQPARNSISTTNTSKTLFSQNLTFLGESFYEIPLLLENKFHFFHFDQIFFLYFREFFSSFFPFHGTNDAMLFIGRIEKNSFSFLTRTKKFTFPNEQDKNILNSRNETKHFFSGLLFVNSLYCLFVLFSESLRIGMKTTI